ncbi:hypothetical protein DPMN_141789 [Dreissena polymorpha]|uniref:Uncharacterized protein n=1 Tax=Dreissena polymorpha TaxID=45954 RepID=A0A9D4JK89_DREPO|nr:hypothetical protein DPMN_141789 [Dreissena polymorpha]
MPFLLACLYEDSEVWSTNGNSEKWRASDWYDMGRSDIVRAYANNKSDLENKSIEKCELAMTRANFESDKWKAKCELDMGKQNVGDDERKYSNGNDCDSHEYIHDDD